MPQDSLIVGVDLSPIKPIPRCITFQSDITTDKCRATLRQHLKTWKADTVLHDGAPNVGTAWVQDAFSQAELVLQSMKLATEFLVAGGTFVTKVFRSKDYNSLMWVFNQLFTKVEATKPPSSRNVSAEIFVVCRGFKAPKHIDPKFLDPRAVFAELSDPAPNNEAKVFNPEKKKRKREGYAEDDVTQYHEASVSDFIHTVDPIKMLGETNALSFRQPPNGDIAIATIDKLPETTQEIRDSCTDLKVLGRLEFRKLLRWRLKVREIFGFASKKKAAEEAEEQEGVTEIEPMDEEMRIAEELQRMKEQQDSRKRKERRKNNETRQKDIVRMQLNMTTPMEIGQEQDGPQGVDAMFALRTVDKAGGLSKVAKGRMLNVDEASEDEQPAKEDEDEESDDAGDNLEGQLDALYESYKERRAEVDARYRAKKARKQKYQGLDEEEFEGFSDREEDDAPSDAEQSEESEEDLEEDDDEDNGPKSLITRLDKDIPAEGALTRRAAMFFDQEAFKGIDGLDGLDDGDSGIDMEEGSDESTSRSSKAKPAKEAFTDTAAPSKSERWSEEKGSKKDKSRVIKEGGIEIVPTEGPEQEVDEWGEPRIPEKDGRPNIDIITAEAMTLAHELATGKKTSRELLEDNWNKLSFRDTDGLPDWFLDDENEHSKQNRPVTKAAIRAIREKQRAMNARPIKKVREAKARKKMKAAQRMEKLKKKSALLLEDEDVSEKDKAKEIQKMMQKAAKKAPERKVTLVVAKGGNRGIKGRPSGAKGRYKMVDSRMKKDMRAEKRLKKKRK